MAEMAAIAIAGMFMGMGAASMMAPDAPSSMMVPPEPETADQEQIKAQQKKRTASAQGRSSTIQTGSQGLGEVGQQNLQSKSLLGY